MHLKSEIRQKDRNRYLVSSYMYIIDKLNMLPAIPINTVANRRSCARYTCRLV